MDKLQQILNRCKCGVFVTVNEHRNYYQTAAEKLEELDSGECPPEIEPSVRAKMIETNTVVDVQFYPATPIGFYIIYHFDLDAALTQALECLGHNAGLNRPGSRSEAEAGGSELKPLLGEEGGK